jgi:hypothetical protein
MVNAQRASLARYFGRGATGRLKTTPARSWGILEAHLPPALSGD